MSGIKSTLKTLDELASRFGAFKTFRHASFRLINRFLYFDCLHIIVLDRDNLKSLEPANGHKLSTKIATLEDLKEMEKQGYWNIRQRKIGYFNQGDTCLLSYVDNKLAGYTWAHASRCPEFVAGLRLSVPDEYLYNSSGFTHPDYRGYGLQSFRHHELLSLPRWRKKKGLLGFVVHTNYSSRRGQEKGGYKKIGSVYVIGSKSHFCALIGKNLRNMGIKRVYLHRQQK
jgi:GNAT superfamily N-acetyltransferase